MFPKCQIILRGPLTELEPTQEIISGRKECRHFKTAQTSRRVELSCARRWRRRAEEYSRFPCSRALLAAWAPPERTSTAPVLLSRTSNFLRRQSLPPSSCPLA